MTTICTICKHQAACGHAEVDRCASAEIPKSHWANNMPMIERTEDADGTTTFHSGIVALSGTPGCSCNALRGAHAAASKAQNEAEVIFFKPSGKYYTEETYEFPLDLHGSIDIADLNDQDRAARLMYDRRIWLMNQLDENHRKSYRGMHAVCTDSDAIGFPMMIVGGE